MKRVIIESPYAGDVARNLRYVRACMRDAFLRGEAPFASHALYTQPGVLRDHVPEERALGIRAGFAWRAAAELTALYEDLGTSSGMALGVEHAAQTGSRVAMRALGPGWDANAPGPSSATPTDADLERAHSVLHAPGTWESRVAQLIADVRSEQRERDAVICDAEAERLADFVSSDIPQEVAERCATRIREGGA